MTTGGPSTTPVDPDTITPDTIDPVVPAPVSGGRGCRECWRRTASDPSTTSVDRIDESPLENGGKLDKAEIEWLINQPLPEGSVPLPLYV
jgi:hypothetical protein